MSSWRANARLPRRMRISVVAIAVALVFVAQPSGAATSWKSWGRSSAGARAPVVSVSGELRAPRALRYTVRHSRGEAVAVRWSVICQRIKPYAFDNKWGSATLRPPATRNLPVPVTNADSCDVQLTASTQTGGRVTVVAQRK